MSLTYDFHIAIPGPLQYKLFMNRELCIKLVARPWVIIISVQVRQRCFLCLSVGLMKLIIIKHCSAIAKMSVCYQHSFSLKSKTQHHRSCYEEK